MRLIDAIKQKGLPFNVPHSSRDDLPNFFKHMGFVTGAEIGVYRGEFTKKFCEAGLKMYAIDPWITYAGTTQGRQDFLYEHTKRVLAPYPGCTIIRKTSMDAVKDFKDGSLDFVYIDGDHRFRYIAEDLWEWEKRVRRGGVVSGHDYNFGEVGPIVDAFVKIKGLASFYVCGDQDEYLSWFWIKV